MLGRAFLQAAFFGYSLDQNVSYLAQAPGPDVQQSVVRAWRPEDTGAESSLPPDAWATSWRQHMHPLRLRVDPNSGEPVWSSLEGGRRVDGATLGGIIGGTLGGFAFLLAMWKVGFWLRGGRRSVARGGGGGAAAVELGEKTEVVELGDEKVCEKGVDVVRFEMGDERAVELGAGRDGEVSPGSDGRGSQGAEGMGGSGGTVETERTVVEKDLEDQDVFEMPGDEPLRGSGGGNEVVDAGVETGLNGRRNMAGEDSTGEEKTVSEREDRPKGGG